MKQWLKDKVLIYSKQLNLLFKNNVPHLLFRSAVSNKAGLFFIAQGINGAIYGALTFVKV